MSDGNRSASTTGPQLAEVALVGLCILAVVLAAILVPGSYVIEMTGPGAGGSDGDGEPVTATRSDSTSNEEASTEASDVASIEDSSPSGIGFSDPPPEAPVGSDVAQPIPQIPLFVVDTDERRYWRQVSYVTYTGTEWRRPAEWRAFAGTVPHDRQITDGQAVDYRVRLLVQSSVLPTVWQPERVEPVDREASLEVARDGAVRATPALPKNSSYRGRSLRPAASPQELREAAGAYPPEIEDRYTSLPERMPIEVAELTDSITADAGSRYEQAVQIRDWLRTNKAYSLNATHEPGQPVVAQFLFEMDAGYCQYFASAMTVMLRTQGIPARYVVGYAGGTVVDENRTLIRSQNAHAWVEVYFPDHGWIRFDPTPAGNTPLLDPQPPYNISLNRTAVPGADVTVSVTKNDTPVIGAPVYIDDRRMGWTDLRGNLTVRLPYQREFQVVVRPPGTTGRSPTNESSGQSNVVGSGGGSPSIGSLQPGSRSFAVRQPSSRLLQPDNGTPSNQSSKTYRSDSEVTLEVDGTPIADATIVVTARIADVPFRNGTVRLDGERVGETNETGRLQLSLDNVAPGTHQLTITRGPFSANRTLEVAARQTSETGSNATLDVAVTSPLGQPLPLTPVTVTVHRAESPVANATVFFDGQVVGTTGANGSLVAWLPPQDAVTVVASGPAGGNGELRLTGLLVNAAMWVVLLAAILGVGFLVRSRFDVPGGRLLGRLFEAVRGVKRRVLNGIVGLLKRLAGGQQSFEEWLWSLAERLQALLADLSFERFQEWSRLDLSTLYAYLRGVAAATIAALLALLKRPTESVSGQEAADGDSAASEADVTLHGLWEQFLAAIPVSSPATKTPGEIARFAVEHGFPEEPVSVLTEAYRDAEYGQRPPDRTTLERVQQAGRAVLGRDSADGEDDR